jgi:beta-galactosidase
MPGARPSRPPAKKLKLAAAQRGDFSEHACRRKPQLWSLETPHLHKLVTTIRSAARWWTSYETTFGIRSIRFDPKEGFFLNGKRVKLKGTNNHQDHAGVGAAIPDALQEFRIAKLKEVWLQRLSRLAQSAHAGVARRLRPPRHAGH